MWSSMQDIVLFAEEILNGKLYILCSVYSSLLIWWVVFVEWLIDERRLGLFLAGTILRDPHHRESLTHQEYDMNVRRTWVQALLNEVVQ